MSDQSAPHTRKRSKRSQDEKTARIDIRVTQPEKDALAQAAAKLGLSLSEYMLLSCSSDPENLHDILRKARPVDRADPNLITALTRANLLLADLRDQLIEKGGATPITQQAILTTLLVIHRQLDEIQR